MITTASKNNQRGEVAAFMTLVAMGIMLVGLMVGTNLGVSRQAQTTQSSAAEPLQTTPIPTATPTPMQRRDNIFTPNVGTQCSASFEYTKDPIIINAWLQDPVNNNNRLYLPQGLPFYIGNRGDRIAVFFDPARTNASISQHDRKVLVVTQSGVNANYYSYEHPSWLTGASPVDFYIEFQLRTDWNAKNGISYFEKTNARGGCINATPTPTPTTPIATPTLITPPPLTSPPPKSPTPTTTPIATPTVEEQPRACKFEALAYIQECEDPKFDPSSPSKPPTCTSIKPIRFDESINNQDKTWGVSNNYQFKTFLPKAAQRPVNLYQYNQSKKNTSYLWGFDQSFTSKDSKSIKISGYNQGDSATVLTFFDNKQYSILDNFINASYPGTSFPQKGKDIDTCWNSGDSSKWACDKNAEEFTADMDKIGGLTVACGNNILYGWTLMKCKNDYDYVFVVDTSTSMEFALDGSRVEGSSDSKMAKVKGTLQSIAKQIKDTGSDSRIALIEFNTAVGVLDSNYNVIRGQNGLGAGVKVALSKNFDSFNAEINKLENREGTCIKCGLDQAKNVIDKARSEGSSRTPIVILITDGMPNSYPGGKNDDDKPVQPEPWGYPGLYASSDALHNNGATIVALGIGNPNNQNNDGTNGVFLTVIRKIATSGWAYITDKDNLYPDLENFDTDIANIVEKIYDNLNTCKNVDKHFAQILRATDINSDGVVNTIDYFMVLDNYFAKGTGIKEDINNDGLVNSLDLSLVTDRIGQSYQANQ